MPAPDPARVDAIARALTASVTTALDAAAKIGPLDTAALVKAIVGAVAVELARSETVLAALVKARLLTITPEDVAGLAKKLATG